MVFTGATKSSPAKSFRDASSDTYEIYPIVRNIEYGNDTLSMDKEVNFIFSDHVDKYTKERAYDVLSLKNVLSSVGDNIDNSKINIILEVYDESAFVTSLVSEDLSYITSKIDAYYLEITNHDIFLTAKDSDSLFYGLASLQFIFEQSDDYVRTLKIKDYSQSQLRGFIEGYYGVPWTSKQRQELMRFGSRVKTNIYIYAPKDDVYHSTSWRSLYSQKDLKILKEQVETGRVTKTRLAWAIHPFMNKPLTRSTFNTDLQIIKDKFDQIYNAGVRQFVFSADDVSITPEDATLHRDVANALAEHLKAKSDCYNLVFVPTTYSMIESEVSQATYFGALMDGLDESISIMWTGEKVCSLMSNMAFDDFNGFTGRKPFVWMNWPVNDYCVNYLLLGKGEVYNVQYNNDEDVEFSGIVTNPMQFAEASKLSIWATADYAWNTKDFDMDKSYMDSFKYIESEETSSYQHLAEHMVIASAFNDTYFEESESVKPLITSFKTAYQAGSYDNEMQALVDYFEDLKDDTINFIANAGNRKLVDEISPWVIALRYTCLAVKQYLYLIKNINSLSDSELLAQYNLLLDYIEESKSQMHPVLMSGLFAVKDQPSYVGKMVLQPFMDYLDALISDEICIRLDIDTGVKYHGFNQIYEGSIANMFDDNESTYCWFEGSNNIGNYIRLDLINRTEPVSSVEVIMGLNDESQDYLRGEVQVSDDAKSWTTLGSINSQRCVVDVRSNPVSPRFLRLYCSVEDTHWVAIREIRFNVLSFDDPVVAYSGLAGIYQGSLSNIVDNDTSTYCWFSSNVSQGGYVLIDYLQVKTVNDIKIIFGKPGSNDKFTGQLQYSLDGSNWTTLCSMNSLLVELDYRDNPFTLRYLRMYAPSEGSGWVAITDVMLNVKDPNEYSYSVTQMVFEEGAYANLWDNDDSTYVHFSKGPSPYTGASIILDIRQVQTINNIVFKQGDSDHTSDAFVDYSIFVSGDNDSFTPVGESTYHDINDVNLDLSGQSISARYIKIVSNWELFNWILITEFNVNTL